MNQEKTGVLIAARRNELGLTQKALAAKLGISDRTVSKWERGCGFPDISLVEALADALGLTVLELLHGEADAPSQEEESSVRDALKTYKPQVRGALRKARRLIALLLLLSALLLCCSCVLIGVSAKKRVWTGMEVASPEEATAISSHILITGSEYALLETLQQEPDIQAAFRHIKETGSTDVYTMDPEFHERYRPIVAAACSSDFEFLYIQVYSDNIYVEYNSRTRFNCLRLNANGSVEKCVSETTEPFLNPDGSPIYNVEQTFALENKDNTQFKKSVHTSVLSVYLHGNKLRQRAS